MENNIDFEKVAVHFQQRLGEVVARYEGDLAVLKTQYEIQIAALQNEVKSLREMLGRSNVQVEEATDPADL